MDAYIKKCYDGIHAVLANRERMRGRVTGMGRVNFLRSSRIQIRHYRDYIQIREDYINKVYVIDPTDTN